MITVPDRPSDLGIETGDGKDEWREGQQKTISLILEAFEEKKFVLANMPTGTGKTIVATAVQRISGWSAVNLTHTIQLQKQYVDTLPWATVVTGRRNHPCSLVPLKGPLSMSANEAPCKDGEDCEYIRPDGCSYYSMLFKAADNPQVVLNYAYATRILQVSKLKNIGATFALREGMSEAEEAYHTKKNPFHRDLLVCDEGDLAEGAIVDAAGIILTQNQWKRFGGTPQGIESIEVWQAWGESKERDVERWQGECRAAYHSLIGQEMVDRRAVKDALRELSRANSLIYQLEILNYSAPGEWIAQDIGEGATKIRPMWARPVAGRLLFQHFKRVLLMSGTLGDPNLLRWKLGIKEEESAYIEVGHTFKVSNRPVFFWPTVKMSKGTPEEGLDNMAGRIDFIANRPSLEKKKGIVHTGSFKIARELGRRLKVRPIQIHEGGPKGQRVKEDIIRSLKEYNKPLVVLSPSLNTGVDIPYEIGWQVIAKVPFANLGDKIVRARRDYVDEEGRAIGKENYDAEAMNAVIQACGRAVRAPDDRGVTYILDTNFWPLYKRSFVPSYFKESLLYKKE